MKFKKSIWDKIEHEYHGTGSSRVPDAIIRQIIGLLVISNLSTV